MTSEASGGVLERGSSEDSNSSWKARDFRRRNSVHSSVARRNSIYSVDSVSSGNVAHLPKTTSSPIPKMEPSQSFPSPAPQKTTEPKSPTKTRSQLFRILKLQHIKIFNSLRKGSVPRISKRHYDVLKLHHRLLLNEVKETECMLEHLEEDIINPRHRYKRIKMEHISVFNKLKSGITPACLTKDHHNVLQSHYGIHVDGAKKTEHTMDEDDKEDQNQKPCHLQSRGGHSIGHGHQYYPISQNLNYGRNAPMHQEDFFQRPPHPRNSHSIATGHENLPAHLLRHQTNQIPGLGIHGNDHFSRRRSLDLRNLNSLYLSPEQKQLILLASQRKKSKKPAEHSQKLRHQENSSVTKADEEIVNRGSDEHENDKIEK